MKKTALSALAAAAVMMTSGSAFADGDVAAGEKAFADNRCKNCHSFAWDQVSFGPSLSGIVDRKAGVLATFNYSETLKGADWVWTEEKLDEYLSKPKVVAGGNRMSHDGITNPQTRADIIAFLKTK